jgi:hypothetical protein
MGKTVVVTDEDDVQWKQWVEAFHGGGVVQRPLQYTTRRRGQREEDE